MILKPNDIFFTPTDELKEDGAINETPEGN